VTADEFRAALERLDLGQAEAARLLPANKQTVHRWSVGTRPVPPVVASLLVLIESVGVHKARRLLGRSK
jgi:DNA-binding transcriptional regulator YiaG